MPIDIAILATTVVTSFLLPFVKMGAQKIAEKVAEKAGQVAGEHASGSAKKAWDGVKKSFGSEEEKATLVQFEKHPDAAKTLVEAILQEKLEKDKNLAQELDELVNAESPDGKGTGVQILNSIFKVKVSIKDSRISGKGHTITGVSIGPSSTPPGHLPRENPT